MKFLRRRRVQPSWWWTAGWRTANRCNSGKEARPWFHANLETATMLILARTHVHAHLHSAVPWISKTTTMTLGRTSRRTRVSLVCVCVCVCHLCTFQVVQWFNFNPRLLHFQEEAMENILLCYVYMGKKMMERCRSDKRKKKQLRKEKFTKNKIHFI